MSYRKDPRTGPLTGLTVLELGHFIAGPFCSRLLADLGATVIKVEPPGEGDPVRSWGEMTDGRSIWWSVHGRNKKSITINLKTQEGRDLALELVRRSRIVVENYRPGQLEQWGLGPNVMASANPRCILVRISGYGQTGPAHQNPAFGVIGEAVGGLRYLTDHPPGKSDLPPVRTGVSLGDSVAGMYGAMAALAAMHEQDTSNEPEFRTIDVALTEAVFGLLEGALPEYGLLGQIRQPTGPTLPTNAPSNAYPTADGAWVLIAANSNPLFTKLVELMERSELADDPRYSGNAERVAHAAELDGLISTWTRQRTSANLIALLATAQIPATKIYTIADCHEDPQFNARGMIQSVSDPAFGEVLHPGVVPRISGYERSKAVRWPGPEVGEHTTEILEAIIGLSPVRIAELTKGGVI